MSQSFTSLGVSAEVEQSLAARGIVEPFRIQTLVVPAALAGGDILGQAPTGSGKTLAFGLPIVETLSAREQAPAARLAESALRPPMEARPSPRRPSGSTAPTPSSRRPAGSTTSSSAG